MEEDEEAYDLPREWGLRRLKTIKPQWAIQYKGIDWLKIEEFLPGIGNSILDEEMRKLIADICAKPRGRKV